MLHKSAGFETCISNMTSSLEYFLEASELETEEELLEETDLRLNCAGLEIIPESIGQLKNLIRVNLSGNELTSLPVSIGYLHNLEALLIYLNKITELPESVTRLHKLHLLQIESDGKISVQSAPIGLTRLPCWNNSEKPYSNMKMSVSEALKKLNLIKYNNIYLNGVSSVLIEKWKACNRIDISNNQIHELPPQISSLTDLVELNLANNKFVRFPEVLEMTWLTSLNVSGNSIIEIPEGISKLSKLSNLELKDSDGRISVRRAFTSISTLPCYLHNTELMRLLTFPSVPPPTIDQTSELREYILPVAPIFDEKDKLGEGGQSKVFKGLHQDTPVAIKILKPNLNEMKLAVEEVMLTKKIPHQNIIKIIGLYLDVESVWIVMELGTCSLRSLIEKKGRLTISETIKYGKQIADALNCCVTLNILEPIHHRDLKTENVLIVDGQAKLGDFGLALKGRRSGNTTFVSRTCASGEAGTMHWQGPEIHNNVCLSRRDFENEGENVGHRGEKSDVYAFGLILWSMATGKYPFDGIYSDQIPALLLNGERPCIPPDMHPTLSHIILSCWRQNYKIRPRFSHIVAVLSMCGAGNINIPSNDNLEHLLPIRYSPIIDMFPGELYQYLTENGVLHSLALSIRSKQMNGELFLEYNLSKFMDNFQISEKDARKLILLQNVNPTPRVQFFTPAVESPVQLVSNDPARPTTSQNLSTPAPHHQLNPKRLIEMDYFELIEFLKNYREKPSPAFLQGLNKKRSSGEEFIQLNRAQLRTFPFNLKRKTLQKTLKLIEELKLQ